MPIIKKRWFKWILIPVAILLPIAASSFIIVSCSNNTHVPVQPTPPIDESVRHLTREDLYDIKKSKTKNNELVGIVGLDLRKVLKDVHVVNDDVSNLPSYFANQENRILDLLNLKRSDFNISFDIIDYDDSLRYSDHRTYFREFERGYPSPLKHTTPPGRGLYSLTNMTQDYQQIGQFTSSFNFSWLDVRINLIYQNDFSIKYQFAETFLFREGIGELIYGQRQGTTQGQSKFVITANNEMKKITGWDFASDFSNIEPQVYRTLVNENTTPLSFNETALNSFLAIKHFKPVFKISDANEARVIVDEKKDFDLPQFLKYKPYLALVLEKDDPDFVSRLITIQSKKNNNIDSIEILANNENIKDQLNTTTIRWHNFGKPGNIDFYYRGSLNASGGSFASVFNLFYQFF